MNLENGDNIEEWFDELVKPQSKTKNQYQKVTVYLANGGEKIVTDVLDVSEYTSERGGLALELCGKSETGKSKKIVFNLTSDNIIGYSIDEI